MMEEFDQEMDFLLRQTAQGETAFGANSNFKFQISDSKHLDSDEISAFAENALPEKTRQNYILHLADCEHCRRNLSNIIALNAESQSEIIHAEEPELLTATTEKIPWYRKLFAVPTLAYAMGALVLLFAGIGVYTVLQKDSMNSQVSQVSEKQTGGKGMSSDGDATAPESFNKSMSNQAAMNSAASSNTMANASNRAAAVAPETFANSNSTLAQRETSLPLRAEPLDDKSLSKPGSKPSETTDAVSGGALSPAPPPPSPISTPDNFELDGQEKTPPAGQTQNQIAQNQTQIMPDTRNAQRATSPKMRKQESQSEEAKKDDKEKSAANTTKVNGKNFTRAGNTWVDAEYRGQTTTNISRGTKEYKKLNSGLRGIVENLGGTVIIVWKEKAYRIQ